MYLGRSSKFILSDSFPISPLSYSWLFFVPISLVCLELNRISLCVIVQFPGHLVNLMVPFLQLTSRLCLTSQSYPKNISIPFKSVTAASKVSLYPLISIFRGATLVISPFFVPSALNTSKEKSIDFIWILLSLTNCLSIPVWVHPESTNAFTFRLLPFFVLIFACTFNFCFPLLLWRFGITYLFWEFAWEISYTVPTWDLCQNSTLLSCCLHYLILLGPFTSLLSVSLYSPWQCASFFFFLFINLLHGARLQSVADYLQQVAYSFRGLRGQKPPS